MSFVAGKHTMSPLNPGIACAGSPIQAESVSKSSSPIQRCLPFAPRCPGRPAMKKDKKTCASFKRILGRRGVCLRTRFARTARLNRAVAFSHREQHVVGVSYLSVETWSARFTLNEEERFSCRLLLREHRQVPSFHCNHHGREDLQEAIASRVTFRQTSTIYLRVPKRYQTK